MPAPQAGRGVDTIPNIVSFVKSDHLESTARMLLRNAGQIDLRYMRYCSRRLARPSVGCEGRRWTTAHTGNYTINDSRERGTTGVKLNFVETVRPMMPFTVSPETRNAEIDFDRFLGTEITVQTNAFNVIRMLAEKHCCDSNMSRVMMRLGVLFCSNAIDEMSDKPGSRFGVVPANLTYPLTRTADTAAFNHLLKIVEGGRNVLTISESMYSSRSVSQEDYEGVLACALQTACPYVCGGMARLWPAIQLELNYFPGDNEHRTAIVVPTGTTFSSAVIFNVMLVLESLCEAGLAVAMIRLVALFVFTPVKEALPPLGTDTLEFTMPALSLPFGAFSFSLQQRLDGGAFPRPPPRGETLLNGVIASSVMSLVTTWFTASRVENLRIFSGILNADEDFSHIDRQIKLYTEARVGSPSVLMTMIRQAFKQWNMDLTVDMVFGSMTPNPRGRQLREWYASARARGLQWSEMANILPGAPVSSAIYGQLHPWKPPSVVLGPGGGRVSSPPA
eukprot:GHVU01082388.1.p1 GENE.GHVU01082388.1~~GHVU01082388.1.p1  ORF type:complete len:570 (+),score=51.50 GHVU01082388.1:196-1710(+)